MLDNPIIFYTTSFKLSSDYKRNECLVSPNYKYSQDFIKESFKTIEYHLMAFNKLKTKSDIEKELYVHNYCLNNFNYDYKFNDFSFSILGLVLNKSAVCEGISKFIKLVFDYLDINCLVVTGKAHDPAKNTLIESHAWNIVTINGKTYHLDVTFNMTLKNKLNRYDYFNLSDVAIKNEYMKDGNTPVCNTSNNDYYSMNSLIAANYSDFKQYIGNKLKKGQKDIVVKLKFPQNQNNIDKIIEISLQQYINIFNCDASVSLNYNLNQMVFEISFK